MADLGIREAAFRTLKMPQGGKGGFLDQHDEYLRGHAKPVNRVASTAGRTLDKGAKTRNSTRDR